MPDKVMFRREVRTYRRPPARVTRGCAGAVSDKAVILATFAIILGIVWAFQMLRSNSGAALGSDEPAQQAVAKQLRGMTLNLHSNDKSIPYEQYVDEIAAAGANTISFVVAARQENCSSTTILIDARKVPPDTRLLKLFKRAKSKGLAVSVMLQVLLENPKSGEWRGLIAPKNSNWAAWWEDYTNFVMHYTRLAQAGGVNVLIIGSELNSTESQTERWRALIAKVRREFKGVLSYSANWDHYQTVKWWDDLDAVGMTTYYDLTKGKPATVERMLETWKPIREKILAWRVLVNRPIIFTEVGWPNQPTCAQYPWNYYASTTTDPQAQANCFEAFFRTWQDDPAVAGVLVYEWRNYPAQETSPDKDISYSPYGKPAMKHIKAFYGRPYPKLIQTATTRPASQPATRPHFRGR